MGIDEVSLKQYVRELINFYASSSIRTRGNAIYRKNNVNLVSYDEEDDLFELSVLGNHRYKVYVRGLRSLNAQTSCTCPYTWGMCKHSVAALKFLASKGESVFHEKKGGPAVLKSKSKDTQKSQESPEKKTLPKEGFEIKNWRHLEKAILRDALPSTIEYYNAINYYDSLTVSGIKWTKNLLVLSFLNRQYDFSVQFLFKNGKVYIPWPKNGRSRRKLTREAGMAVAYIANSKSPDLLELVFSGKLDIWKKEILEEYGLAGKKFNDYFEFGFSYKEGPFYLVREEFNGLLPVKNREENAFTGLVREINESSETLEWLSLKTARQKRTLGFVLGPFDTYYYSYVDDAPALKFLPVIAKINKAGTQMINSFQVYRKDDVYDEFDIPVSENQKELMRILWLLDEIDEGLSPREKFNLQKQAVQLLGNEKFVLFDTSQGGTIHKKDLIPLEIAPGPLTSVFEVGSDDDFVKLELKLRDGDKTIDPFKFKRAGQDSFYYLLNRMLYTVDHFHAAVFINKNFPEVKMVKSHKQVFFEEVIRPLSKNMKVEFRTPEYNVEALELDFDKKQVFLSEKEGHIFIAPQVEYRNGLAVALYQTGDVLSEEDGRIVKYQRNFELENDFTEFLATLHPDFARQKEDKVFYLSFEDFSKDFWFYRFFDALRKNEVEVYGLKDLKNFKYSPHRGKISTSVRSGIDWFEVNLEVVFGDNRVSLKDIRSAVLNRERYIQLKDGSVGILPEEWFHKLEKYFRHGEVNGEKLEISGMKFSIIDELFDEIDDEEVLREIEDKKQKLLSFKEIAKTKIPKGIKAELRHYQKEGVNWLNFLDEMGWGGILADDMGLGKTLQVLTFLQQKLRTDKTPNLIVVPTTLLFNWEAEIKKFAPGLKALYHYGPARATDTKPFKKYPLVFTTYGILLRDIEMLKDFQFNYVILDESQAIKNPASRRYKAAGLLKAKNRLALTGTPIENSTFDLYAQMSFVNRGFFGSSNNFKTSFSNPIDKEGNEVIAAELQKMVNPFILRRTKEMVAKELPPKTEDILFCEMDAAQRKVYDAYRNEYRNRLLGNIQEQGLGKSKMMVLEALTRLRQICDSPLLLNKDDVDVSDSVKIRELIRHINDKTANHKILIFSQFVTMLGLIKAELDKYGIDYEYLDGQSSRKQRQLSVNRFQDNADLRVFLISLKAGGTGINLTAADYVYVVDPWWNPAVENQAIDRCYRIGQDKNVFAYRMICTNTVEEKILQLQQKKKKIATDIIQTDESIMKNLSVKDIESLFS